MKYRMLYKILSCLYAAGESSSKGIYGEHPLNSLSLTEEEIYEIPYLVREGYVCIFESVWGRSMQFTTKGLETFCSLDEEIYLNSITNYRGVIE